jgi:hypothetical protein
VTRTLLSLATAASLALCIGTAVIWCVAHRWPWRNLPDFDDRSVQYRLDCGPGGFGLRRWDLRGPVVVGPRHTNFFGRADFRREWDLPVTVERPFPGVQLTSPEARVETRDGRLVVLGVSSSVVVPNWAVLCCAAALPALHVGHWFAARIRKWRRAPGVCGACGYDLRATPGRCPECGAVPSMPPPLA